MATHPYLTSPPLAIAHRGGYLAESVEGTDASGARSEPGAGSRRPADWEENSRRAFERAVALGYRYLETDVHATADGVLMAFHDDRLERVSDGQGRIADLRHEEVEQARIGGELPIPTMEELLLAFASSAESAEQVAAGVSEASGTRRDALNDGPVRFNVDLKANSAVLPMWRLLERHAMSKAGHRVCVASFSSPRLWLFRALSRWSRFRGRAEATTSAGPLGVATLRLLPSGLTRLLHSPGVAYQVPVSARVLGHDFTLVTPGFVRRAHELGKQVHVWTINDETEMRRLLAMGVDGIVTDAVDTLARVLGE